MFRRETTFTNYFVRPYDIIVSSLNAYCFLEFLCLFTFFHCPSVVGEGEHVLNLDWGRELVQDPAGPLLAHGGRAQLNPEKDG